MRSIIFLVLLPLFSMLYANTQAQELRLRVNQIFTPQQDVQISISLGYYYRYSKEENRNETIALNLYKPQQQEEFLINVLSKNQQIQLSDSSVQKATLTKSWQTKISSNDWGESNLSLGKLEAGIYIVEALHQSKITRLPILISDFSLITKKKGKEIISFVADMETGKQQPDFEIFFLKENEKISTCALIF